MGKPQFGYWSIRGLGQQIRFALAYMGVDYEHVLYHEENEETGGEKTWKHQKTRLGMDAPNLPYWFDDKVKLTESAAVLKYVVRTYAPKLMPTNTVELSKAEQVEGILGDIMNHFFTACYSNTKEAIETFNTVVPVKMEIISKIMGKNTFLLGNELCYLDFVLYETFHMVKTYNAKFVQDSTNLVNFMETFEKLPAIAKYMKSPEYIKGTCCGASAKNRM